LCFFFGLFAVLCFAAWTEHGKPNWRATFSRATHNPAGAKNLAGNDLILVELQPTRHEEYQMKTKVIVTLCIVFGLGLVSNANAQLVAGSPEEKAFTAIENERNADAKIALLLGFEKDFPQSRVLPDIYVMLMDIYRERNDTAKVIDFGERAIKIDGENLTALLAVSRNLAIEKKQIDKAIAYAQKAVDTVAKLRSQPAPPQYGSEADFKEYLDGMDQAAKSMLAYARSLKP
jgi:hypothetical protein